MYAIHATAKHDFVKKKYPISTCICDMDIPAIVGRISKHSSNCRLELHMFEQVEMHCV